MRLSPDLGLSRTEYLQEDTMTTTDQIELDAAFALLREIVGEQHRRGRRCFSAGLKPAMQKRVPGFFEGRLGFTSFREFLEAAAARRVGPGRAETGPVLLQKNARPRTRTRRHGADRRA